jgi:predicted site-specific integrase-resolvase
MPADLIPTSDVCRIFGVTRAAVSLWVAAGKLTPVMRTPTMLFERAEVAELARSRAEQPRAG